MTPSRWARTRMVVPPVPVQINADGSVHIHDLQIVREERTAFGRRRPVEPFRRCADPKCGQVRDMKGRIPPVVEVKTAEGQTIDLPRRPRTHTTKVRTEGFPHNRESRRRGAWKFKEVPR